MACLNHIRPECDLASLQNIHDEQEARPVLYDRIELEIKFVAFFQETRAAWEKLLTLTEQDIANMFKRRGDLTIDIGGIQDDSDLPMYCRMVLKFRELQPTPITGFYTRCDSYCKNILLQWAGIQARDLQKAKAVLDFCVWFAMFKFSALDGEPIEVKSEFDDLCKSVRCGLKAWCMMSNFLRPIVVKKYLASISRDGDECFISQIKFDFGMRIDEVGVASVFQNMALSFFLFGDDDAVGSTS